MALDHSRASPRPQVLRGPCVRACPRKRTNSRQLSWPKSENEGSSRFRRLDGQAVLYFFHYVQTIAQRHKRSVDHAKKILIVDIADGDRREGFQQIARTEKSASNGFRAQVR